MSLVFERIRILPKNEYIDHTKILIDDIKDPNDACYLAASIVTGAEGIWIHDPHFKEQKKVKVFTNIDMIKLNDDKIIN